MGKDQLCVSLLYLYHLPVQVVDMGQNWEDLTNTHKESLKSFLKVDCVLQKDQVPQVSDLQPT